MTFPFLLIVLCATALLLLLLLSFGFQPRVLRKIAGTLVLIVTVLGLLMFGYGYCIVEQKSIPLAIFRTLYAVFELYLGKGGIGDFADVPLFQQPWIQILYGVLQLLAIYCTASAVASTIGARLLRRLNLLLLRHDETHLIYGVSERTVGFAEQLMTQKRRRLIFVAPEDTGFDGRILQMGSLVLSDDAATGAKESFLRRIGVRSGKNRLNVYCIGDDPYDNLRYANLLSAALQQRGIQPEQTALTVILPNEEQSSGLQADGTRYGYGSVLAYENATLISRLLIRSFPPCRTVAFDENGRAKEDFYACIVGFGKTGQAVLRSLVINAQFEGSRFHALIVSKDHANQSGSFFDRFPGILSEYDVRFVDADARSTAFYEMLSASSPRFNYTVVCTGSKKDDEEIAEQLSDLFRRLGIAPPIVQCSSYELRRPASDSTPPLSVYTPEILCSGVMDREAMRINHTYHRSEGNTPEEDWRKCGYFERMSCRASADYLSAFLYATGKERDDVIANGFSPSQQALENLAKTEHLRWCAFHYAMGYLPMSEEVWRQRASLYLAQKDAGQTPLRISRDAEQKRHACLTSWEALRELSEKENAVTGGHKDYQKLDCDHVMMIASLLQDA